MCMPACVPVCVCVCETTARLSSGTNLGSKGSEVLLYFKTKSVYKHVNKMKPVCNKENSHLSLPKRHNLLNVTEQGA